MLLRIVDDTGYEWILRVPVGYISDRASVPRMAHFFATPAGDLELASYPHDLLYSHGGRHYGVDKAYADEVFRATLKATPTDIPVWKIQACYLAVKLGGDGGWKNGWAPWDFE